MSVATRPRVFCASLADWLDDEVPIEWLADLLKLIHDTPNLNWQLLTKRPENFEERLKAAVMCIPGCADGYDQMICMVSEWIFGRPPGHIWIGTTVENQEMADKRIPLLLPIPAKVRFLSCEPLLGPVNLELTKPIPIHDPEYGNQREYYEANRGIHWVICGGESGSGARPMHPDWARSLRDQCQAAVVPFFVKQMGGVSDKRGNLSDLPEDLRVREFPV